MLLYDYKQTEVIEFSDLPESKWTFITGECGSGKTSLLRQLSEGSISFVSERDYDIHGNYDFITEHILALDIIYDIFDLENIIDFTKLPNSYRNIIKIVNKIYDYEGVVIIDEIENGLSPNYQTKIISKFTEHFPNIRFIVSTNSPLIIKRAPIDSIIIRTENENGTLIARRLDEEVKSYELMPHAILSSPIFDYDLFLHEGIKFTTEDDYSDVVFDRVLNEKLRKIAKEKGKNFEDFFKNGK